MPACNNCGFEVAELKGFCPGCGRRFDEQTRDESVPAPADNQSAASAGLPFDETLMMTISGAQLQMEGSASGDRRNDVPGPADADVDHDDMSNLDEVPADDDQSELELDAGEATDPAPVADVAHDEPPLELDENASPDDEVEDEAQSDTNDFEEPGSEAADSSETPAKTQHANAPETDGKRPGLKPLSEGTVLNGRYEIVRKIGGGGMGAVYLAKDLNLGGVERAVKEMVQSSIEEEAQNKAIDDFKRESMILSTLDHPSIPTIYDYFYDETEGRFYLVMKYISGGDLAGRLRAAASGRIDERTVTEWALQITDVLAYLHGLPTTIVYRDLKPSNIMLDRSGRIVLIDFGIARSINQQREKGVTAVGTMGYAPPELFSGQVEPRSDIYSLGSTMFHLMTGADPQNNPLLIFDFQKNPRPRQINPQLSDQMERILMKSVEYNAERRFTTADEMRDVLANHLENLRTGNVTYGVTEAPAAVSLANQTVFCGFCGQRIVATDLFCAFCGAKQPIAQQGVHAEIYPRTGVTAKLVIDGTTELDVPAFMLEKNENLVGRRDPMSNIFPEVDLSKFDPQTKISRRHARIWREGGQFMIEDLGSSNGTVLLAGLGDQIRLQPRVPRPLSNGDRLRLGDTTLHFITQ
jgi:eukaryotic-like serine/threonine-protein kinase